MSSGIIADRISPTNRPHPSFLLHLRSEVPLIAKRGPVDLGRTSVCPSRDTACMARCTAIQIDLSKALPSLGKMGLVANWLGSQRSS